MRHLSRVIGTCAFVLFGTIASAQTVVISQVYGGGGNNGATLTNDYIEIFNRGTVPVDISAWSVQYASAAGSSWQRTNLSGTLQPGQYYLVQQAQGLGGTTPLPAPDASGTIPMSGTAGKVALVRTQTFLTCSTTCTSNPDVVDFVGYGNANGFEGSGAAPTLSNTTAAIRAAAGCTDTNDNAANFSSGAPAPRNSASPTNNCSVEPTCVPTHTIADVQGNGLASPVAGATVAVAGVVTGRITTGSARGFFVQMPDGLADADPMTSNGVFVFTGNATPSPLALVGNEVCVRGAVSEFSPPSDPGSAPLTEIALPSLVTLIGTGRPLPAPITITAADARPDLTEALERFEGMRVKIDSLTAIAPTAGALTEADANSVSNGVFYGVITGVARPFREPGIDVSDVVPPGTPAGAPRFDGNPERIRVDSDLIGAAPIDVTTHAVITNLVGPLTYAFRTYTLLPDPAVATSVSGLIAASAVPTGAAHEITVASFNLKRFYDTQNDPGSDVVLTPQAFERRLQKVSLSIRTLLQSPDIIGVSEAEHIGSLQAIADRVNADTVAAGGVNPGYVAELVEGNDIGGIDVGFLVKSSRATVLDVEQEGKATTYINPQNGQPELLNDRPPLVLRASVALPSGPVALTLIANHLRSLSDLTDAVEGGRVRAKRRAQAEFLASLIQARQVADPDERIVVLGDMNAFQFNDGYVDVIGTVKGTPTPASEVLLASPDLIDANLIATLDLLPAAQRYSFMFDGNAQSLDHVLLNQPALANLRRVAIARGSADFPEVWRNDPTRAERTSDHDMPVVYLGRVSADESSRVSVFSSGLVFNRVTRTFNGTIQITNTSATPIVGPVQLVLDQLTPGVTLVNAAGTFQGLPYVAAAGVTELQPGQSTTVAVQFSNPSNARIGYVVRTYAGAF